MQQRRLSLEALLAASLPSTAESSNLVWEVGCGHGHFLTAYSAQHPQHQCVGIDIASDRIARATRKQERAALANLHFIRADAALFLETLPAHLKLSDIFVLFPDPWPKARHHKHRLIQPSFLASAARRAAPGGRLFFRTDHRPYFDDALQTISSHPNWSVVDEPWPFEYETVFQSRAETYQSLVARVRAATDA